MRDSLQIGLAGTVSHTVTEDMSPPHLPTKVLSTPSMVGLIELACLEGAQAHLDDGETTVGIHVCISHSAVAEAGEEIEIRYELTDRDRKKLTFTTEVTCGDRTVSEGTHQRFVVGG